jgi:hypothetical protein
MLPYRFVNGRGPVKTAYFIFGVLLSFASLSHAECGTDMKPLLSCLSTPVASDGQVIARIFEKIDICKQGDKTIVVMEGEGKRMMTETEPTGRVGSTLFPLLKQNGLAFSVATRPFMKTKPARLMMNIGDGASASSTFTCQAL